MATFKTFSQIVRSMQNNLRLSQPNLDTKPGTVSRDLFIDIPADELETLYRAAALVSEKQNPQTAVGDDLDKWARNFGITRTAASPASGVVVFTTNSLLGEISIPEGTIVGARNGVNYRTIGNYVFALSEKSRYAATANRLRSSLQIAGINDQYAIEIPVVANTPGRVGNIASLQIIENDLFEDINVTNLTSFNGGENIESDAGFRARIFSIFSGANTGTAAGYINAALSISGVLDVLVVEPGNTLMLRDGTETIELEAGRSRILNSGNGGKADIYILGSQLEEVTESYIYTDKTGRGDPTDERNDYILGVQNIDTTLTSEERRVQSFATGVFPLQPVEELVSVTGTSSGLLAAKSVDAEGNVSGNYELVPDTNVDTGGSPFGFDKLSFISNKKVVDGESITKQAVNSVDPLSFTEIDELTAVYQDIQIQQENSTVSSADRTNIILNHSPVVTVNRITNVTTGEIYVIEDQNIDDVTGLNEEGRVIISGKTLPNQSDILSAEYTWRIFYEETSDYNGRLLAAQTKDSSVADSIDWGIANTITEEESVLVLTDDDQEFQVNVDYSVSRVLSVYTYEESEQTVEANDDSTGLIINLDTGDTAISNILRIVTSDQLEVFNTRISDGTFSGRQISLPTDTPAVAGDTVTVKYNKVEYYSIDDGNGVASSTVITLPSRDILSAAEIEAGADELVLAGIPIYVDYVAAITSIAGSLPLSSLPISDAISNNLFDTNILTVPSSNQPVFYTYDEETPINISRYGPTRLSASVSGISRSGRIRVSGETLTKLDLEIFGNNLSGLTINLETSIKEEFGLTTIPANIGIARVGRVYVKETGADFDIQGYALSNINYAFGLARLSDSLSSTQFTLPDTPVNDTISVSSGQTLVISVFVYNTNDTEDLFFQNDGTQITDKVFARITSITAFSGFRNTIGNLIGNISIKTLNQPAQNSLYFSSYNFESPKEGERITVKYNINRLILDVSTAIEDFRTITADVLIKESPSLAVDVVGELLINEDALDQSETIKEDVANQIVNLLNTSVLGGTVDYSDLVASAASVSGVDSVNISLFNESGNTGRRSYIRALDNQNIVAGTVIFTVKSRSEFKIT